MSARELPKPWTIVFNGSVPMAVAFNGHSIPWQIIVDELNRRPTEPVAMPPIAQRWEVGPDHRGEGCCTTPSETGDWISYEDYAALRAALGESKPERKGR